TCWNMNQKRHLAQRKLITRSPLAWFTLSSKHSLSGFLTRKQKSRSIAPAFLFSLQQAIYQDSFSAWVISTMAFLPSPNNIRVLSLANSGLGRPAKPALNERLTTTTVFALSTLRIGMP